MPLLLDLTPLRVNSSYRRLYSGFAVVGLGAWQRGFLRYDARHPTP